MSWLPPSDPGQAGPSAVPGDPQPIGQQAAFVPIAPPAPPSPELRYPVVSVPHGVVPPGGLGLAAQIFVGLTSALLVVVLVIEVLLASEIGSNGVSSRASTIADLELVVLTGAGVLLLIGGIVNLVLFHRLAANGAKLIPAAADHRPHWAVTGWFVPIMNLFRPYQMAKQIWRSSASSDRGSPQAPEPALFKLWWGFTIASYLGDRVVASTPPETVDALAGHYWLAACSSFLFAATGFAYLFVVRALIERQERGIAAPARPPVSRP